MKFRVSLLWKVVLPLEPDALNSPASKRYFNVSGGKTFVRSLGGDFRLSGEPYVLCPTDLFHRALSEHRIRLGFSGNRFPYHYRSSFSGKTGAVNVSLHSHVDVLCATIRVAPFDVEGDIDWYGLRDLRKNDALWSLVKLVLSMSSTGVASQDIGQEPRVFPLIHICAIDGDLPNRDATLVSLVTGHQDVKPAITLKSFEKNEVHQIDSTVLLVDKQGAVSYTPHSVSEDSLRANFNRFENAGSMLQLAAVARLRLRRGARLSSELCSAILNPESAVTASVSGLNIWSVIVAEFHLHQLLLRSQNSPPPIDPIESVCAVNSPRKRNAVKRRRRVLLFTVTEVESAALRKKVLAVTGATPVNLPINGFSYRNLGIIGDVEIIHQISGMGSGGTTGSQETVGRGIKDIKPMAVIMVGIAFGIDPSKQPIGTILISNQIQQYELQRINNDSSISIRSDKVTASHQLLTWARHTIVDWPTGGACTQVGVILSGDKLIDSRDYRNQIVEAVPESVGGEMEGSGLYVACQTSKTEWLLIKSVCDWADGNKSTNKSQNQSIAADSAAEFTVRMLQENLGA